jgi:hypothetical protein
VLAALPHLQIVVNRGDSVQLRFLRLFLYIRVICCICGIKFRVSACQNPVLGSRKLPYDAFFAKGHTCGISLPPANHIFVKGKAGLHSDIMWYDREYVALQIGEIGVL